MNRTHQAHGLRAHSKGHAGSRICWGRVSVTQVSSARMDSIEEWRMGMNLRITGFVHAYKKGARPNCVGGSAVG